MGFLKDDLKSDNDPFLNIELEKLFKTEEERETFQKIQEVLKNSTNSNQTAKKIAEWGEDAIVILIKLGKLALKA